MKTEILLSCLIAMLVAPSCAVSRTSEMPVPTAGAPRTENKAVEAAKVELARGLSVDPAQIRVDSLEQVSWPDSCLGIPTPGEDCSTIETPGFRVILQARDCHFTYHTDLSGENIREETAGTRGG